MSDCMTLYEDTDYKGHYAKRCSSNREPGCSGENLGRCGIMPCADDSSADKCWRFGDKTSSLKVDEGMVLTLYKDPDYQGDKRTFDGHDYAYIADKTWNNKASSWKLQKDCSHSKWLWDKDCANKDSINIINHSKLDKLQQASCKLADLSSDANCKGYCFKDPKKCKEALRTFCSKTENESSNECKFWKDDTEKEKEKNNYNLYYIIAGLVGFILLCGMGVFIRKRITNNRLKTEERQKVILEAQARLQNLKQELGNGK